MNKILQTIIDHPLKDLYIKAWETNPTNSVQKVHSGFGLPKYSEKDLLVFRAIGTLMHLSKKDFHSRITWAIILACRIKCDIVFYVDRHDWVSTRIHGVLKGFEILYGRIIDKQEVLDKWKIGEIGSSIEIRFMKSGIAHPSDKISFFSDFNSPVCSPEYREIITEILNEDYLSIIKENEGQRVFS